MNTKIEKEFDIDQPIELVWKSLADPSDIVTCVPGAAITEKIDDRNYKGEVVTKFGPIKAKYTGDIEIVELNEAERQMTLKGRGLDSKGKGSADMIMNGSLEEKDGKTRVNFSMDITIVGMLAQFGSRLINDVSDQLLNQFVDNFSNKLAAAAPASVGAATSAGAAATASVPQAQTATPVVETQSSKSDNSLDATSLFGTVVKSIFGGIIDFIKSLFTAKK